MSVKKAVSLKSKLSIPSKKITIRNPHLPSKTQTDVVFDIVKRSVLKKAKKEGKKISGLELRLQIDELMKKWPKQNWPKIKEVVAKK